jgi:hypothetical protein
MFETNESRRDFLKKTAYVTPFILTMNVSLAEAQAGSRPPVDAAGDFSLLESPSGGDDEQPQQWTGTRRYRGGKHSRRKRWGWWWRRNGDD